jgi:hypothetical protein
VARGTIAQRAIVSEGAHAVAPKFAKEKHNLEKAELTRSESPPLQPRHYAADIFRSRRASSAASAKSQSRNVMIFGFIEVAFGQTIQ